MSVITAKIPSAIYFMKSLREINQLIEERGDDEGFLSDFTFATLCKIYDRLVPNDHYFTKEELESLSPEMIKNILGFADGFQGIEDYLPYFKFSDNGEFNKTLNNVLDSLFQNIPDNSTVITPGNSAIFFVWLFGVKFLSNNLHRECDRQENNPGQKDNNEQKINHRNKLSGYSRYKNNGATKNIKFVTFPLSGLSSISQKVDIEKLSEYLKFVMDSEIVNISTTDFDNIVFFDCIITGKNSRLIEQGLRMKYHNFSKFVKILDTGRLANPYIDAYCSPSCDDFPRFQHEYNVNVGLYNPINMKYANLHLLMLYLVMIGYKN